ncbi:unnamed protein product [Prorocentrum cordatum]|uniref:Uncharacterized protein n=1 Tax=Prorocentrum cordatum TaxID=2364126 RepID=A0ABN9T7R2_9DINO|nr:unnamed protein product [Polarella glacialis]
MALCSSALSGAPSGGGPAPPSLLRAVQGLLLMAAVAAQLLCLRFFEGRTLPVLVDIAARWSFVRLWERSLLTSAGLLLAAGAALSGAALLAPCAGGLSATEIAAACLAAALGWAPLLNLYLMLAMTIQFCSLGLDAFAVELLNAPHLSGLVGLVGQFNVLNAAIHRAAYTVQPALTLLIALTLALAIAALVRITLPALNPALNSGSFDGDTAGGGDAVLEGGGGLTGDAVAVAWVAVLLLLGLRLLERIAVVNLKCKRLPALVHCLDFGHEIDHDRWCVAAHIAGSGAGFHVHSVLVSRGAVLKLGYVSVAGVFLLATRLLASFRA